MREAKAVCGIDSFYGAPGWNRTNDPQLRRLMLYPTELRARPNILPTWKDGPPR